jgi:hypothetical protein
MYWELVSMIELCTLGTVGLVGFIGLTSPIWGVLTVWTFFGAGMILMDVVEHYDSDCNLKREW